MKLGCESGSGPKAALSRAQFPHCSEPLTDPGQCVMLFAMLFAGSRVTSNACNSVNSNGANS
jgi:hypothetical protein